MLGPNISESTIQQVWKCTKPCDVKSHVFSPHARILISLPRWCGLTPEFEAPTIESETGEALTFDQLVHLAKKCSPHYELVLVLGLGGLRFGEVAGLRVSSVDFETSKIHIR